MLYYFLKLTSLIVNAQAPCGPQQDGGYILCTKIPGAPELVKGPVDYLTVIYTYSLGVVGLVGFGLLVWSGVNYIFQRSNYAELADIKDHITQIIFGIILLVFASILLNEIDPNILNNLQNGTEFELININKIGLDALRAKMTTAQRAEFERQLRDIKNLTFTAESINKVQQIFKEYNQATGDKALILANLFEGADLTDQEKILLRSLVPSGELRSAFTKMSHEFQQQELSRLIKENQPRMAAAWLMNSSDDQKYKLFHTLSIEERVALIENFSIETSSINAITTIYTKSIDVEKGMIIDALTNPQSPFLQANGIKAGKIWTAFANSGDQQKSRALRSEFATQIIKNNLYYTERRETNRDQLTSFYQGIEQGINNSSNYKDFINALSSNNK